MEEIQIGLLGLLSSLGVVGGWCAALHCCTHTHIWRTGTPACIPSILFIRTTARKTCLPPSHTTRHTHLHTIIQSCFVGFIVVWVCFAFGWDGMDVYQLIIINDVSTGM